jgi:hypothetical protein
MPSLTNFQRAEEKNIASTRFPCGCGGRVGSETCGCPREGITAKRRLLAVLLNAGGAQSSKAVAVDRVLPSQKFLDSQGIAAAGLLERKKASAHGRNDFRFATDHPAFRSRRWKVGNRKRTAIGPDNILHPRAVGLVHTTLTHLEERQQLTSREPILVGLRFA